MTAILTSVSIDHSPMPMAHASKRPFREGPASALGSAHELIEVARIDPGQNDRDALDLAGDNPELQSLAESLKTLGSINPIHVEPGAMDGRFVLIAGERRWRAAKMAGWQTIPAFVCRGMGQADKVLLAFFENVERKQLSLLALAKNLARLATPIEQGGAGLSREAIAKLCGKKGGSWATNIIKLLRLPPFFQQQFASGQLGQREGRALVPYVDRLDVLGAVQRDLQAHPELWDKADKFELRLGVIVARLDGLKAGGDQAGGPSMSEDSSGQEEPTIDVEEAPAAAGVSPDMMEAGPGPVPAMRSPQRRSAPVDHSLPNDGPTAVAGDEQQPRTAEQILAATFDLLDLLRADQLGPVVTYTDRRARGISGPEARLPSRRRA